MKQRTLSTKSTEPIFLSRLDSKRVLSFKSKNLRIRRTTKNRASQGDFDQTLTMFMNELEHQNLEKSLLDGKPDQIEQHQEKAQEQSGDQPYIFYSKIYNHYVLNQSES